MANYREAMARAIWQIDQWQLGRLSRGLQSQVVHGGVVSNSDGG
jgi:hypothetical protein